VSIGKFVLPYSSWGLRVSTGLPWWQLGRIRIERDLALCELLNGDVGNLHEQILCLLVPLAFIFCCMFMFFVFLSSIPRVSYLSLF
jgi:hypothetical protein